MRSRPTSDYVAVVLALGLALSVVALVIGVTVGAIKNGSTASTLSENESQVLTAAFGGMIGVLGAWVGYRTRDRGEHQREEGWPELHGRRDTRTYARAGPIATRPLSYPLRTLHHSELILWVLAVLLVLAVLVSLRRLTVSPQTARLFRSTVYACSYVSPQIAARYGALWRYGDERGSALETASRRMETPPPLLTPSTCWTLPQVGQLSVQRSRRSLEEDITAEAAGCVPSIWAARPVCRAKRCIAFHPRPRPGAGAVEYHPCHI